MKYKNGDEYNGLWKEYIFIIRTMKYNNGDIIYEGDWKNNKRNEKYIIMKIKY